MGISVIIRNRIGMVLAMLSEPKDYIITPDVAEVTATLRVAKFSSELWFYKVVLKGDAL
jgi:hypothetical protein